MQLVKLTPPTRPTTDMTKAKLENMKPTVSNSKLKTPTPQSKHKVKHKITMSLTPTKPMSSSVVALSRDEGDVPDDIVTSVKRAHNHVLQMVYHLMGESLMPFSDLIVGPVFDKQVRQVLGLVLTDKAASIQKQLAEHWKKQVSHHFTIMISYYSGVPIAVMAMHQKVIKIGCKNSKSSQCIVQHV